MKMKGAQRQIIKPGKDEKEDKECRYMYNRMIKYSKIGKKKQTKPNQKRKHKYEINQREIVSIKKKA